MKHVLVFSPYAKRMHLTAYEGTIAKACELRGARVEYIICDGLLPECDMHWDSFPGNYPRPLDLCKKCQDGAKARMDEFGLSYRWLGEFVGRGERDKAFAWAQGVPVSEISRAFYDNYPVGEWVLSSVVSYFRQYPPDMNDWHVVNVYRGFLLSAALVLTGLKNYLAANHADSALLFNGRQSVTRVAFELFRESGIRVLTHEYPFYQDGHLMLKPNARCWSPQPFEEYWRMWGQVPLVRPELQKTLDWLKSRRYGMGLSWYAFNNPYIGQTSVRKELGLSRDGKVLALFTSSTDETAGDSELQGPFESQSLWVQDVLAWAGGRRDIELVVRVHPHLAGRTGLGKAMDEYNFYQGLKSCSPGNVRIVMPDDPLNSYALMDGADVGLTYGSSAGIEMAMLGKPIVLGSRAFYENGAHILTIRSKTDLPRILEKSLQPFSARELRREAFRLAYYQVYKFELPFPLVEKSGVMDVRLSYSSPEALAPGKDETIDHACKFLVEDEPLFDPPDDAALKRSTSDEDDFFDQIERSPAYLRDYDYEKRAQRVNRLHVMGRSVQGMVKRLPFGAGFLVDRLGKAVYLPLLDWVKRRG